MSSKPRVSRPRRSRRKVKDRKAGRPGRAIVSFFLLLVLLLFSLGAAGYVIFFRTTLAHGAGTLSQGRDIAFEEPYPSLPELPSDIPVVKDSSLPLVAIIIDDMGYHRKIGRELLALPLNLTFSFLAAAPFTGELEESAFETGRVVMLHQPMEPKSNEWDPGPGAMLLGQSPTEQALLLEQNLRAVPHAVGVNNHMGSAYTEDREAMDSLMVRLRSRGLFFVDSFTTAGSQGLAAARRAGVPTARRQIFLDNVQSQDKVCEQIQKLVDNAEAKGWALGIGHPNQATLAALSSCQTPLLQRVRLVSAQELVITLKDRD